MPEDSQLAIVIPAYKPDFLNATLASIAAQSNKNFRVYIGDDASPDDIYSIVRKYESSFPIVYKRFDQNMGGYDLVEQWNRCMSMIEEESWVWMFSDDDIMGEKCVELFYEECSKDRDKHLFHFNVKIIDEKGQVTKDYKPFPKHINVPDFQIKYWKSELSSYVVEYIFSRKHFELNKGFEKFKYAWHTDEATWAKLGYPGGITTIDGANVFWRRSSANITPNNYTDEVVMGKLDADMKFSEWVQHFYRNNNLKFNFLHKYYIAKRFVRQLFIFRHVLAKNEWQKLLKEELHIINYSSSYVLFCIYYYLILFKSKSK